MKAIILAGGKGTRLQSELTHIPKAMRTALGRPLIDYVLENISEVKKEDIYIVVGFEKEKIMEAYPDYKFVWQKEQLGTGHAALCAEEYFKDYDGEVLVICGDTPLIQKETIKKMHDFHREKGNACTVLSCLGEKGLVLGRIIRDENGSLTKIVENRDCSPEELEICEYNTATYIFDSKTLFPALHEIMDKNIKHEVYLTDVPEIFLRDGIKVDAISSNYEFEIIGVNTVEDLTLVENTIIEFNKKRA